MLELQIIFVDFIRKNNILYNVVIIEGKIMQTFSCIPVFQNSSEKSIVVMSMVFGIFFGFIPFLIVMFACKDNLSETSYEMIKAFANLELCFFIICFAVGLVPLVGLISLLVGPAFFIWSLILILSALQGINNNSEVKIPVMFKIF